jgi:hypothetical protein
VEQVRDPAEAVLQLRERRVGLLVGQEAGVEGDQLEPQPAGEIGVSWMFFQVSGQVASGTTPPVRLMLSSVV